MPKPRSDENRKSFLKRCIPQVLSEGVRGKKPSQPQAVAVCNSMWREKSVNSSITFLKQSDGTYRWAAIWTNKYRDEDNPPEILTEAAHIDFARAVNKGDWPYPELWLWHIPESKWGVSTIIAYDKSSGFMLGAGTVDKGMEPVAEDVDSIPAKETAVSHGMPPEEIQRDSNDESVLVRYRSNELSPLSYSYAANKLTSFELLGGNNMELEPKGKEVELKKWLGGEAFDRISKMLNLKATKAADEELEFKDTEEEIEEVVETETEPEEEVLASAETEAEDEVVEAVVETEEAAQRLEEDKETSPDFATKEEVNGYVTDVMAEVVKEVLKSVTQTITDSVAPLQSELSELKSELSELKESDEEKITKKAAWTPAVSVAEYVMMSAIGKEETHVDGRKARHDGPKETEAEDPITRSGHPAMNAALQTILTGEPLLGEQ